jgi:hypothetical protein
LRGGRSDRPAGRRGVPRLTSFAAAAALVLALLVASAGGALAAAGTKPRRPAAPPGLPAVHQVSLLYSTAAPSFAVLQTLDQSALRPGSVFALRIRLFATEDFVHFRDITPPGPPAENGTAGCYTSVSFPTPEDGWVAEGDADCSQGFLFHTTDGGSSWQLTEPLWSGNGGGASISFLNASDGWLLAGDGGDGTITFSRTTDGGSTWQPLLDEGAATTDLDDTMPTFSSPLDGFVVATGAIPPSAKAAAVLQSTLETTDDGGATWSPTAVPLPVRGEPLYETPTFFGPFGVLPVLVLHPDKAGLGPVTVAFDTTSDDGGSWSRSAAVASTAIAKAGQGDGTGGSGLPGAPSVAVASPDDWWAMSVAPSGRIGVSVTRDAGARWTTREPRSLPVIPAVKSRLMDDPYPLSLQAVNGSTAFAVISLIASSTTYVTIDGGIRWRSAHRLSRYRPNAPNAS